MPRTVADLRREIVGADVHVPVLDGTERRYIYLDNAASTPSFSRVLRCVEAFLPWYSGVHRGTGFKSVLATEAFDAAHETVGRLVGADPSYHTVIFTKNTTECVNKLANRMGLGRDDVVITTLLEHHSNDLPWRKYATVLHAGMLPDGRLDLARLKRLIEEYAGRVKVVAVTGASNITGLCSPVHEIAAWTHGAGAQIFVDAAQLAPHRPIELGDPDDPAHIDFLALSAHKMYAPYGTGALIGPRAFFETGDPDMVGGGVVDVVTLERAYWNQPPGKEEAGSPNVVGGIALAEAAAMLMSVGMDNVAAHEAGLLRYAYDRLATLPGLRFYGPTADLSDKVGVITFNLEGMHHALVAAIMGVEGAIGVRNGCFCAHPYVKELLGLTAEEDRAHESAVRAGDKSNMPGMIRASIGCYNAEDDIDALVEMTGRILRGEYQGTYVQNRGSGAYHAEAYAPSFSSYFPYLEDFAVGLKVRA
ncbi:MAG TPA: aminotransferase class V-fold PLP-dependent enzyme [Bacteroidota bacterium]